MADFPKINNFIIKYPKFSLEFSEGYKELIDFYQRGELSTKQYFSDIIQSDWNIVDVGANIGMMTLLFSKLVPKGKVLSIEASEQNFNMLQKNISKHDIENVTTINAYVSESDSEASGEIHYLWTGRGSVARTSGVFQFSTLDTIIEQNNFRPDLIKIDIDGYDFEAVKGCVKTLDIYSPILLVELVDEALQLHGYIKNDVIEFLKTLGYNQSKLLDHCNYIFEKL